MRLEPESDAAVAARSRALAEAPPTLPAVESIRRFLVPPPHDRTPASEARYLLTAAAEIEHGLLAQYLYAAYSLVGSENAAPDDGEGADTASRILAVAVEEMGHLLNVQNLLLALGDPPYFDRENYTPGAPTGPPYPFPFVLEPVDRTVLAKYVAAESPLPEAIADETLRARVLEIIAIGKGGAGSAINHVGVLYAQLHWLFQPTDDAAAAGWPNFPAGVARESWHIPDADLTGLAQAFTHAAGDGELRFTSLASNPATRRFVQPIAVRENALLVIRRIAEQGEGLTLPHSAADDSHFEWFLSLYDGWPTAATPVRAVPRFPNTADAPSADPVLEEGRLTYAPSRAWALFCDVRYEILLLKLALMLAQSRAIPIQAARRSRLERSAMEEMRQTVGPLAVRLMALPRRGREPDGSIRLFAGPAFSLPDAELPREGAAVAAELRRACARASAHALEIKNLTGPDAPTTDDREFLDRITSRDTQLLASLP